MAKGNRQVVARDTMRFLGAIDCHRAHGVFVQVGTADAAPEDVERDLERFSELLPTAKVRMSIWVLGTSSGPGAGGSAIVSILRSRGP